jgi:putative flavoprotein involved in K+ transport
MPETHFTLRWPDGFEERCYSPSSVIGELLSAGTSYPMKDFLHRTRIALVRASNRVEAKYGFACSSAMAQLDQIEARAATFDGQDDATVTCLNISQ